MERLANQAPETLAGLLLAATLVGTEVGAQRREPAWPLANGRHDVLHSFQNPFSFSGQYFHEGVDLRGRLDDVVAMRSGVVRFRSQNNAGGTLVIEVATEHGVEADSYLHVRLGPWLAGDAIAAGDVVGQVSDSYFPFPIQDHLHVNRFAGYRGGTNYVPGRTNMLHPLVPFSAAGDHDPQTLPAGPSDANRDGSVFRIARPGNPALSLPFASGAVELLLEATDRQSNTLFFDQGLVGVGYWIESFASGEDVATAEKPYRLVRFDDAWRASSPNCDALVASVMVSTPSFGVDLGPDDTGWDSLATYRLTRAAGFTGRAGDISATQAWHTDVRRGTGLPNGTGGTRASDIREARFPDGLYRVHALTEDLVHQRDTPFDVLVNNFQPYVTAFRVRNTSSGQSLLELRVEFDGASGRWIVHLEPEGRARPVTHPGDRLVLEVEFSEPMARVEWARPQPRFGTPAPLASDQPAHQQTRFQAELRVERAPDRGELLRLRVRAQDLAGVRCQTHSHRLRREAESARAAGTLRRRR